MIDLIESTPNAKNWIHECKNKNSKNIVFGEFKSGVVWTDDPVDNGKPVGGDDPSNIIQGMNNGDFPLFSLHDEGRPIGRVLSAKSFTTDNNRRFVAAIFGFYTKNTVLSLKILTLTSILIFLCLKFWEIFLVMLVMVFYRNNN